MALTVGELTAYLDVDQSRYNRKLDQSERRFSSFSDKLAGLGVLAGKAAVGGVVGLAIGLGAGAIAGMKFNSSIEQTTIAMGTMLGSTSKAKTLIGEVTKMAAATPFEFPELADATKKLVAYGVSAKDAVPLMTRLGDVSSALAIPIGEVADLYGKMKVSGRITMEDINQMAGRGIPIYGALAKVLGVNQEKIRGMVEEGKIGFPDVEKAFVSLTDKGSMFGGMMDKQSRSMAGLWSTIKDGVIQVFATAMKPLFNWLVDDAMPSVVKFLPKIQGIVSRVMTGTGRVFEVVKDKLKGVPGMVKTIATNLATVFKMVKEGDWEGLGAGLANMLTNALKRLGDLGKWIWDAFKQTDWFAIGERVGGLAVPFIVGFATGLGDPAMIYDMLKKHWLEVVILAISLLLMPAKFLGPIMKVVAKIPFAGRLAEWLVMSFNKLGAPLRSGIWTLVKDFWESFLKGWSEASTGVTGRAVKVFMDFVRAPFRAAIRWVVSQAQTFYLRGLQLMEALGRGLRKSGPSIIGFFMAPFIAIGDRIVGFVRTVISWLNKIPGVSIAEPKNEYKPSSGSQQTGPDVHGRVAAGDPSGIGSFLHLPSIPKGLGFLGGTAKWILSKLKNYVMGFGGGLGATVGAGRGYSWAADLARRFGLSVTSTYRPGAITAAGYRSDHGIFGKAADIAGSPGAMQALANWAFSTPGSWHQAIFGHNWVNDGRFIPGGYAPSDHFDHVHLARGDASSGGGTTIIPIYLDGAEIARYVIGVGDGLRHSAAAMAPV